MRNKNLTLGQCLLTLLMLFIIFTMTVPLLNILAISLSDPSVSPTMSSFAIIPKDINFINYEIILNHPTIMTAFGNSVYIAIVGTFINIALTMMAAYALTRPKLRFKKTIMTFLIVMMVFDPGLIPEYLTIQDLDLMNSHWSIILLTAVNVYYLVIMMRYFESVPQTMYEAAQIDGAGHLTTLWKVVAPLAKPGIATITMFYGVARWNEYFKAGLYIPSPDKTTLPVLLRQFIVDNNTTILVGTENILNYNSLAQVDLIALKNATIVVSLIPILLVYPLVLRFYARDIMGGGVKE